MPLRHYLNKNNCTVLLGKDSGVAYQRTLKETISRDFRPQFFHKSMAPRALINTLKYFRILFRIRGENRDYVLTQRYVA
jgi:hypothetical protein